MKNISDLFQTLHTIKLFHNEKNRRIIYLYLYYIRKKDIFLQKASFFIVIFITYIDWYLRDFLFENE